jgi:flagellar L-ring protein precursor FlgH
MNISKYIISLIIISIFSGCSSKVAVPTIKFNQKSKFQIPKEVVKKKKNRQKGSLFTTSGSSLFADKKDLQTGDIIQVEISESVNSNTKNSRKLSKSTNVGFNGPEITSKGTSGFTNNAKNFANKFLSLGIKGGSKNSFDGKSESKVSEKFITVISAVIEEAYQNGNYYIKGTKEMLLDGQKQVIVVSGVIRPYDLTPDNRIKSSQIANLKLLYQKDGDEKDAVTKPWGSRIIDKVWPF